MAIDLSKISQKELDQMIKEEALRRRAEMLSESKKNLRIKQLQETKERLEAELASLNETMDMEEGLLGKLFGGGGDEKRKQMVVNLLSHPNKGPELLKYASDEQIAQFKQYAPAKAASIDKFVQSGGRKEVNPDRVESYIKAYLDGAKYVKLDPKTGKYVDAALVPGNVGSAFAEGKKPKA